MTAKIVYLVDHYVGPQAGTEGQLLQLVRYLDRSRYEPSMTLFRGGEYIEDNPLPCPVKVLDITRLASLRAVLKIVRYALALRREGCRLVHCFFNDSSIFAPFFLKVLGIRVLVSRRDMGFWYTPLNLAVLRLVAPFVDCYVANSRAVKQRVRQQEWVSDEKISVIYNGYVFSAESPDQATAVVTIPGVPHRAPVVGIVANLRPIKRMDTLVEAFALASRQFSDARLVIVGDKASQQAASTLAELEALASGLGIRERVIFVGRAEDPMPYINRFTVAVLCSESEGFSNSIIEYMSAGCPTVCTDVGGNAEIVRDGHNGFLVPAGDVGALADRLVQLLSDDALARRLGEAGAETVRAYTHTRMVAEQMVCYDRVLAGSSGRWRERLLRWLRRT
ncbi:MAG: glycosyltransferase [Candidatus Competibacter sp.]|nr:glycosyltransferase [Candidatus Competibacter sp.]